MSTAPAAFPRPQRPWGPHVLTRLLVADDEIDIRVLVGVRVRHLDVEVVEAADGAEALEACSADPPPDVVVLDQRMPGHSGLDVARELRARGLQVPVAIFSAYVDEDLVRDAAEIGVVVHTKSDLEVLAAWVEQQLEGAPA